MKLAADLAAKELEETLENEDDDILLANEAIDGLISWILDLMRLGTELDVEEIENLHFGCGTPTPWEGVGVGRGRVRDTASCNLCLFKSR